jgi:hypothetical protein
MTLWSYYYHEVSKMSREISYFSPYTARWKLERFLPAVDGGVPAGSRPKLPMYTLPLAMVGGQNFAKLPMLSCWASTWLFHNSLVRSDAS